MANPNDRQRDCLVVCVGRRCGWRGRRLARALARRPGTVVIRAECLALCRRAPVVVAYPTGNWYGGMTGNASHQVSDLETLWRGFWIQGGRAAHENGDSRFTPGHN